jgi:hypothetical protein
MLPTFRTIVMSSSSETSSTKDTVLTTRTFFTITCPVTRNLKIVQKYQAPYIKTWMRFLLLAEKYISATIQIPHYCASTATLSIFNCWQGQTYVNNTRKRTAEFSWQWLCGRLILLRYNTALVFCNTGSVLTMLQPLVNKGFIVWESILNQTHPQAAIRGR